MNNKQSIAVLIIVVILAAFFTILLNSCNVVNKYRSNSKSHSDSSHVQQNDSSGISKKDSTAVKKNTEENTEGVDVEFENSDTTDTTTEPVIISKKGDSVVVNPGTRKIKSVSVKNSKKTSTSDSTHVRSNDSTSKKEASNTKVVKDEKKKEIDKKSKRFPISFSIGILLIIAVLIINELKQFLPFKIF